MRNMSFLKDLFDDVEVEGKSLIDVANTVTAQAKAYCFIEIEVVS